MDPPIKASFGKVVLSTPCFDPLILIDCINLLVKAQTSTPIFSW